MVFVSVAKRKVTERVRRRREPYDFKTDTFEGRFESLIAAEDVTVEEGEDVIIKVEPIEIPPHTMVLLSPYARNPYGHVLAVAEEFPKMMELGRKVEQVYFVAVRHGRIRKGDVLGVLILIELKGEE
ncbi:DUF22 domain-containing protein [Methanopyrus sp.]